MTRTPVRSVARAALAGFAITLMCALAGVAAAGMTPTERVREAIDQIIVILKDGTLDRDAQWAQIGTIIDGRFDFRSMSQSVLATNWRKATPDEKRRFVEFFSQYLEDTYRSKIQNYTSQRVEYLKETVTGDRAEVETAIVTESNRIPVSYRLKNNDGEWFAYDAVIERITLVNNSRSTFEAIVKSAGMDGLLTDLQGRIEAYKAEHGGLPHP